MAKQKSIPNQTDSLDTHENFILLELKTNFEKIKYHMISETSYRGFIHSEGVKDAGK